MTDDLIKKRFLELYRMNYDRDIPVHTGFLTLEEQDLFLSLSREMSGAEYLFTAGHDEGERRMVYFPASYESDPLPPIEWICVAPAAEKFAEELTHRDYLGALMSLGIERDRTGDILIDGKTAYIACLSEIADYVADSLTSVRHTKVECSKSALPEHLLKPKIEEFSASVSSARLDSVIGIAFRLSRGNAQETIAAGYVFVNGKQEFSNSRTLSAGDRVSVRHRGKFIFYGVTGESKKGRSFVKIGIYRG